jgi:hypothetical protein
MAERDAQRPGGQQAQAVKSAAGSVHIGCLGVAGTDAILPERYHPTVLP